MPSELQSVTQLGYATRIPMGRSSHALIALALAIATATLLVPGANDAAARTDVTPQSPIALLREMSEFLRKQQSLAFHSEVNFELYGDDQKLQFAGAVDVRIRRPNRFSIDYRDDLASRRVWYDGSKLTLLDPAQGVLASSDAPPVLDDALDYFEESYGLVMPLSDLISDDIYRQIAARAQRARYVGLHDVDGEACHHLAFKGDTTDLQLWIRDGDEPVPCKLVIDYKEEPGRPSYVAVLMDWEFGKKYPDSEFAAKIPEGVLEVEFLGIEEARR